MFGVQMAKDNITSNVDIAEVYVTARKLEVVVTGRVFELDRGTPVKVIAPSFDSVLAELPSSDIIFLPLESVRESSGQRLKTVSNSINLFLRPSGAGVEIGSLDSTKPITIYGYYGEYAFVSSSDQSGWTLKAML